MLTRLRNANSAYHDEVTQPHSKIKANIAGILKQEGYIEDYSVEDAKVGKTQRLSAITIVDELPRSAIGKVLKRELRDAYAG